MARASSKKSKKKTRRAASDDAGGGLLARLGGLLHAVGAPIVRAADHAPAIAAAVLTLAVGVGWALAREPLRERVAQARLDPVSPDFAWPTASADTPGGRGWMDPAVAAHLEQIVAAGVSPDPFDRASLELVAKQLDATGWFAEPPTVARRPEGRIEVRGPWRAPAAVVELRRERTLVGHDGAPMVLPAHAEPPAVYYRIYDPFFDPPAFGVPWSGGDVTHAIELLTLLAQHPDVARHIVGVDLSEYMDSQSRRLLLRTDRGATIVWGAPPSEPHFGEVSAEQRLAHLRKLLTGPTRLDEPGARLFANGPVVELDHTAGPR